MSVSDLASASVADVYVVVVGDGWAWYCCACGSARRAWGPKPVVLMHI